LDDARIKQLQDTIDAIQARQRVQEFAVLELLHALPKANALAVANGLRGRVNEWALGAGAEFTSTVDEAVSQQLVALLGAVDDGAMMPAQLQLDMRERNGDIAAPTLRGE
jgi:hypothetical protein